LSRRGAPVKAFDPADFPALGEFLSGYLHEDYVLDYASPAQAAQAFAREASAIELRRLKQDAVTFGERTNQWRLADVRSALRTLGSAWTPRNRAAMVELLSVIAGAGASRS